jgi:hypothetical protein
MIENLLINREEFLHACNSLEAALKLRDGTHWVTLQFAPGELRMISDWGVGSVETNGKADASGKVAYNHIKLLIRAQGIKKLKKDTLACILAPALGKLVIEDAALKVKFE